MTSEELLVIDDIEIPVLRKKSLKNLYIHADPPLGAISVKAPENLDISEIELYVLKKLPEIAKAKERFASQPRQTPREYVSGEACYLWGKPYRLQVVYGSNRPSITKEASKLVMRVPDEASADYRKRVLTEWYRKELKRVLPNAAARLSQLIGVSADEYSVKNMKTKWGTCNIEEKRIWVNLQLVKKPPECLDYVLVHELVHLLERNHTHRFNSLVQKYCPVWRESKALLSAMPLDSLEDVTGNDK